MFHLNTRQKRKNICLNVVGKFKRKAGEINCSLQITIELAAIIDFVR